MTIVNLQAQIFDKIDIETENFAHNYCKTEQQKFWLNNILKNRDTIYFRNQVDSMDYTILMIAERLDTSKMSYTLKERYAENNRIQKIIYNKEVDSFYENSLSINERLKTSFSNLDTFNNQIIEFGPEPYYLFCGCGQVPAKAQRKCFKEGEKEYAGKKYQAESFAWLITYYDKKTGKVVIMMEIPIAGERELRYSFSPLTYLYDRDFVLEWYKY